MNVTVIIPTLNAGRFLPGLLDALSKQTVGCEILVIDSSSADNTREIAEKFRARVIGIRREEFDHGGTRTLAGKNAQGEFLVYLTQDVMPADEHAIGNLIRPLCQDEKIGASYGRQLPNPDADPFTAHLRSFNYPAESFIRTPEDRKKYGIKAAFLSDSFAAYRKNALESVGWFRDNLISTEDTYAGAKLLLAGYNLAYASDARVYHSHNHTALQEFRRYFDIGVFHEAEKSMIEEFGRAEDEGKKYIASGVSYLVDQKRYHLVPLFFCRSFLKLAGYKLGRNNRVLPAGIVVRCSMNRAFWKR